MTLCTLSTCLSALAPHVLDNPTTSDRVIDLQVSRASYLFLFLKKIFLPSYCFVEACSSSFSCYSLAYEYLGIIPLPYLVPPICFVVSYAH